MFKGGDITRGDLLSIFPYDPHLLVFVRLSPSLLPLPLRSQCISPHALFHPLLACPPPHSLLRTSCLHPLFHFLFSFFSSNSLRSFLSSHLGPRLFSSLFIPLQVPDICDPPQRKGEVRPTREEESLNKYNKRFLGLGPVAGSFSMSRGGDANSLVASSLMSAPSPLSLPSLLLSLCTSLVYPLFLGFTLPVYFVSSLSFLFLLFLCTRCFFLSSCSTLVFSLSSLQFSHHPFSAFFPR